MTKAEVAASIKKWIKVAWDVPAIKSVALTLIVRAILFVGLPAGAGVVAAPLVEAIVNNL